MPAGGSEARSEALAELSVHLHQLSNKPELAEWFDKAESESLSADETASLAEMKRVWQQETVLPEELVEAKSLAGSKCEHAWRTQRGENDWEGFEKTGLKWLNFLRKKRRSVLKRQGKHLTMPC